MEEIKPKTTEFGGTYYEQLPTGTRKAYLEDFYNEYGQLLINKAYLVHSMINPDKYWANRVLSGFPYPGSDFKIFMEAGMVYVWDGE